MPFNPLDALQPPPGAPRPVGWPNVPSTANPHPLSGPPYRPFNPTDALRPVRPGRPRPTVKPNPKPSKPKPGATKPKPGGNVPHRTVTRNGVTSSSRPAQTYRAPDGSTRQTSQAFRNGTSSASRATGGGARPAQGGAAPADDGVNDIVDEIIKGMNAPYVEQARLMDEQFRGEVDQNGRLGQMYDQRLAGLQSGGHADLGSMLQRAAELKGISAETIAKNQAWLTSIMGQSEGGAQAQDTQAAAAATGADIGAVNDQMAREIGQGGQRLDEFLTSTRAAGGAATREFGQQAGLRRGAAMREIDSAINANRSKAPALARDIAMQEREAALKEAVAQREWGLDAARFQSDNAYKAAQVQLGYDRLDAQGRPKPPAAPAAVKPGRYGNIPVRYDAAIQKVYESLNRADDPKTEGVDESRVVRPWRTAFDELTKQAGLNPTTAALLTSKWYPESITSSNPFKIITLLRNRGVSEAAQSRIVDQAFGRGTYANVRRNPAGALGQQVGN